MIAKRVAVLVFGAVLTIFILSVTMMDVSRGGKGFTTEGLESVLQPRATGLLVDHGTEKQYLFIGDVHGMYDKLKELLDAVSFEQNDIQVVFVGDFITKGPDDVKVLEWMMDHRDSVHFVIGNNEFSVLMCALNPDILSEKSAGIELYRIKESHLKVAQSLSAEQVQYISEEGHIAFELDLEKTGQRLVTVHAGLLPLDYNFKSRHLELHSSIVTLTNMKYMNPFDNRETSRDKKAEFWQRWYKLWEAVVPFHNEDLTIIYGHDAKKGLNIRKYTKGLDSGAVKGGKLSALLYKYDLSKNRFVEQLVQV